jgi:RNA polymerase sigma factor (sigma-70 family)
MNEPEGVISLARKYFASQQHREDVVRLRLVIEYQFTSNRSSIEDIVQTVFVDFFARCARENEEPTVDSYFRSLFSSRVKLLSYLTTCARHRMIDFVRSEHRRQAFRSDVAVESLTCVDQTNQLEERDELMERVCAVLTERHRRILNLRLEGYTTEEVAEVLSTSRSTIYHCLYEIRKSFSEVVRES